MNHAINRRNHYRLLHVQPEAPLEVIKSSYRALMMRLRMHPDLGGDHEMAAAINEAYAVLSDPQRRAEYDRQLRQKSRPERMRALDAVPGSEPTTDANRKTSGVAASTNSATAGSTGPNASASTAPRGTTHPADQGTPAPAGELYNRTARPLATSARLGCAFCQLENTVSRQAPPLCSRCGAPLTPVRPTALPNFGAAGFNRRVSARRSRQTEAVAYWGMPPQRHRVLWRDLSAGGLSVWSVEPLVVGQRMQLMDPDIHTVAEVVACDPAGAQRWLVRARLLTLRPIKRSGLFCATQA